MSEESGNRRVLCVDDESNVLDGLRRNLRRKFDVSTAHGAQAALLVLDAEEEPFAVVMSDLRMPGMDGVEFLSQVRAKAPDTTRVLLTGNADLGSAISAVNEGHIFRFLTKPCPTPQLVAALEAAVGQHRLVTAERELLERTLHGSVKMLTETLALANPEAFGRAARLQRLAGAMAERLDEPERWKMEMAAMLSQVAYITLPSDTLERISGAGELTAGDDEMLRKLPAIAESLISEIPRLEDVSAILRFHAEPFAGTAEGREEIPAGARILKAVLEFDQLESHGVPAEDALEVLRARAGVYDPVVLAALGAVNRGDDSAEEILTVPVSGLRPGMVLLDPVESCDGRLLVARGQEVAIGLIERLHNFARRGGVKEPLRVLVRSGAAPQCPRAAGVSNR